MTIPSKKFSTQIVDVLTGEASAIPDGREVRFVINGQYIALRISEDGGRLIAYAGGSGVPQAFVLRPASSNTFLIGLEPL